MLITITEDKHTHKWTIRFNFEKPVTLSLQDKDDTLVTLNAISKPDKLDWAHSTDWTWRIS